jgi:hypothetical protein
VSNHAHRRPQPEPEPPSFWRRLFGLKAAKPRKESVAVGFASSRVDAELMAGYLRNQGIHAVVSADDEGGLSPALATGQRVRILAPQHQHAEARKLLDERE